MKLYNKCLIITAVEAERAAVRSGLQEDVRFEVVAGGVGPISVAATASKALMSASYELVISAGIAGGFKPGPSIGSIVLATDIIAADLGIETPEGVRSLNEMGYGQNVYHADQVTTARCLNALRSAGLSTMTGPILTVSMATGTAETLNKHIARMPGAAAEAMEGFGVAAAASLFNLPVIELRAISNIVGPRNIQEWRMAEALAALSAAFKTIKEVL